MKWTYRNILQGKWNLFNLPVSHGEQLSSSPWVNNQQKTNSMEGVTAAQHDNERSQTSEDESRKQWATHWKSRDKEVKLLFVRVGMCDDAFKYVFKCLFI